MFLPLDPSSGLPIFRQIMDQVRRMVASGSLEAGQKLESVRDLATRLRINPLTVGKAYQELERAGVIEMRRGLGMFVCAPQHKATGDHRRSAVVGLAERLVLEATQAGLGPRDTAQLINEAWRNVRAGQTKASGND